tara:strand:+ start:6306 stop:6902 length:597 start_codon:yes stop_codon:yes gene_type:complete
MTDVSFALEAKSDQLNALDIIGAEPIIRIREVQVKKGDQPISVYFDGDHGRPWKPSKGMLRILAGAWGRDSSQWEGKYAKLYFEPTVMYAGKEVGGIRIKALSDIDPKGLSFALTINRQKREPYHVPLLKVETAQYPADRFEKALPTMAEKMQSGEMTLQQVIAQCQKTGQLTPEQLKRLEEAAPVAIDENDSDEEVY